MQKSTLKRELLQKKGVGRIPRFDIGGWVVEDPRFTPGASRGGV